ncbi:MAG: 23S rRNA (adenine(2503)-C(2))-methyltransferase RlmN [Chloroflexi bacterium]|nr:23S rRNA (adenine(2503)-C(2))-methyltransferase RlmN [Chloroflexota bacterium]
MNDPESLGLVYDHDLDSLLGIFEDWGEPTYRGKQIWEGLYRNLWGNPSEFTNISNILREKLADNFSFNHLSPISNLESKDKLTQKSLFRLTDGKTIEAVLMRYNKRCTLCISTQVGCAMGCTFCATGQMGFGRNLSSGEIVEQVIFFSRYLKKEDKRPTNIVVMGMGEPLHNYESTIQAIRQLNHPDGFNLGMRRITVSTVGIIPAIRRFAKDLPQVNLAISLHAADDELRSSMLPINEKYPIHDLMQTCREYTKQTGRRISFEWTLIQGINDTFEQAQKLSRLIEGMLCHVNLVPLNPTNGYDGKKSSRERAKAFKSELESHKIPCTIRVRRGIEILAGCGQLATNN